jgi:hypothetical protein
MRGLGAILSKSWPHDFWRLAIFRRKIRIFVENSGVPDCVGHIPGLEWKDMLG